MLAIEPLFPGWPHGRTNRNPDWRVCGCCVLKKKSIFNIYIFIFSSRMVEMTRINWPFISFLHYNLLPDSPSFRAFRGIWWESVFQVSYPSNPRLLRLLQFRLKVTSPPQHFYFKEWLTLYNWLEQDFFPRSPAMEMEILSQFHNTEALLLIVLVVINWGNCVAG